MKLGSPCVRGRLIRVVVLLTASSALLGGAWHVTTTMNACAAAILAPPPAYEFNVNVPRVYCFAPGTDPAIMAYYNELMQYDPILRYQLADRWPGSEGDPIVLRWSLVPDGLIIDGDVPSDLFSTLDAQFGGNRAVWISKIQACFDRWQALTGITYQRITYGGNDWDDGASWGSSGSSTRGDVRISGKNIDGPSNVLAYDYYPGSGIGGDMVLDTSESWGSSGNDYRFLRNVIMHEHGHGIGLAHVCPTSGTRLMEPFLNTNFDGPQHDDARGAQRHYGDPFESDNSAAAANDLGTLTFGVTVSVGPVPPPTFLNGSVLSIDANGEVDWFKFTVTDEATLSVTVTPKGMTYDSSPQNGDGSCQSGNYVDSLSIANLNVQIIGEDGTTVIATAASQPAGGTEELSYVHLPTGAGTYYIKVYEGNSPTESQLYHLTVQANAYDPSPPAPDPMTFVTPPYPAGIYAISMVATTASDGQSPPVYYYFDFIAGGPNGTDGYWRTDASYTDLQLQPNTEYTYQVKARDNATPPNETAPSAPFTAATFIETPAGTALGTVTADSIEIFATGTITNLTAGSSGLYFDCIGAGCDNGLNQWTQVNDATAVGLQPNSYCVFRAKARNRNGLETPWSQFNAVAYTLANVPGAPVLSNPTLNTLQLAVAPNGNPASTAFAIQCSATADPTWSGKFLDATGQPVTDAVWQTAAGWGTVTIGNLQSGTQYCFYEKARNNDGVETDFSPAACAQTTSTGGLPGDLNCDDTVDFSDINPFVLYLSNFANWQATFPDCPASNGDINGDGSYPSFDDINPFVALLTARR
jgi:serralysin